MLIINADIRRKTVSCFDEYVHKIEFKICYLFAIMPKDYQYCILGYVYK